MGILMHIIPDRGEGLRANGILAISAAFPAACVATSLVGMASGDGEEDREPWSGVRNYFLHRQSDELVSEGMEHPPVELTASTDVGG